MDLLFKIAQEPSSRMGTELVVVHEPGRSIDTEHGFIRGWGVTGTNTGAKHISMAYGVLPPGVRVQAQYHLFETALYIVAGKVRVFWGETQSEYVDVVAGDFIYIPAWVIHSPMNLESTPMEYVVARNAPEEVAFIVDKAA